MKENSNNNLTRTALSHGQYPIEFKILEGLRTLEPGFLKKIIDQFCMLAPQQIKQLDDAIQERDVATIQNIAHGLKSSSAMIGAMSLSSLFEEMELSGKMNKTEHAPEMLSKIQTEYRLVRIALKSYLDTV
jgi:HPt (histidine-containing phosphotransfer) domain-containing protein